MYLKGRINKIKSITKLNRSSLGKYLQKGTTATHLVLPNETLMQDSVEVGEHVSRQWDVMMPHHHHTQQPVGHRLAPAVGRGQSQGLGERERGHCVLEHCRVYKKNCSKNGKK